MPYFVVVKYLSWLSDWALMACLYPVQGTQLTLKSFEMSSIAIVVFRAIQPEVINRSQVVSTDYTL